MWTTTISQIFFKLFVCIPCISSSCFSFSSSFSSFAEPCCALKYYPEIEICVKEQKGEQVREKQSGGEQRMMQFSTHKVVLFATATVGTMYFPGFNARKKKSIKRASPLHFFFACCMSFRCEHRGIRMDLMFSSLVLLSRSFFIRDFLTVKLTHGDGDLL